MPTLAGITPQHFVEKWSRVELSERSASQQHFLDLCRLLAQPAPADHDATGAEYAFEKGIDVTAGASVGAKGDRGFADVWWKDKFAWEYKRKGKYKDLNDAYRQLLVYRESLGNPPLLIVSDIARTEIHTNFTGTTKQVHSIALHEFTDPAALDKLRRVFTDPESFKPQLTVEKVTQDVAAEIGKLAVALQKKGHEPLDVAHFLMKCVFCLFAEDIDLLPNKLFKQLLSRAHKEPTKFKTLATNLFEQMRTGGEFGVDPIPFFNGGLFDDAAALDLNYDHIGLLLLAAGKDWSAVEPHIFGTLFERALDPSKRAQIGAHYTGRDDIMLVVEPVIMAPLRREWDEVKSKVAWQVLKRATLVQAAGLANVKGRDKGTVTTINNTIHKLLGDFQDRLARVHILDPACGSGNFLYIALQQLLNLEKEVIAFGALPHIAMPLLPRVRPTQLYGIEINTYAAELASVVIWIGYLQWMRDNGFVAPNNPVLENMETIENRDAILDLSDPALPVPAKWPQADFIIGNPPFLGNKLFRQNGLSTEYITALYAAYDMDRNSDLCCYWFEQGSRCLATSTRVGAVRIGLLATQGIRGEANRKVLERIKATGAIFNAWSDREWVLEGAAVNVSIICFDSGEEVGRHLNGKPVTEINANLSGDVDTVSARRLKENKGVSFVGGMKKGQFDVDWMEARTLLATFGNPNGRTNADVLRPWINGLDITRRPLGMWIIDFASMKRESASQYEAPFKVVQETVKPERDKVRTTHERERWWLHARPVPELRTLLAGIPRYIGSARVAKHRLFTFLSPTALPDGQIVVFARGDDYIFGALHSSTHELWALRMGTQLEDRPRYTPSTTFETFPLPWPPGKEDANHPAYLRIAAAGKGLNDQRERWLNPPEWIEPLAARIDAADDFADVPADARSLVRQSAIMAAAAKDPKLKKRTLTNLYNERPTWLRLAHETLDRAVLAAYAATDPAGDWDEDWAAVWVDSGAGQPLSADHPLTAKRAEVDQRVLANLLRLNHARAREKPGSKVTGGASDPMAARKRASAKRSDRV